MAEPFEKPTVPRRWNFAAWIDDIQAALPPEIWQELLAKIQEAGLNPVEIKTDPDVVKHHKIHYVLERIGDYVDF